ncbi:WYL domain-containing protein [Streptomyces sp. TS71-3]|uniref:WYL domain-containing protein n=1 Tax=Streptomyces sp. TS71-3 TaxID=2733862 RepID=UPI0035ABD0ED
MCLREGAAGARNDDGHGERDGGSQDPQGAARAVVPGTRHGPGIPRIHSSARRVHEAGRRARLPAGVARLEEIAPAAGADPASGPWLRVELRAETLDWLPPVLASLDRPFVIERPDELRHLVIALADRLASCARQA